MTATVLKLQRTASSRLECEACGATASCDCGVPYVRNAAQKHEAIDNAVRANPEKNDLQIAKAVGVSHPSVAKRRSKLEESGDVEIFTTRTDTRGRKQPTTKPRKRKAKATPQSAVRDRLNDMARRPTEFTQQYIQQLDAWLDGDPQLCEDAVMTLSNALHLCAEEYERMAKFVKAKFPTKGER